MALVSDEYEIALVSLTFPVTLLLRQNILSHYISGGTASFRCQFITDFVCIAMSGIICMTLLSSHQDIFITILSTTVGILWYLLLDDRRMHHESIIEANCYVFPDLLDLEMPRRMRFMTYFRSYVLVSAAIAILGVDFHQIFPRRFSKSHTYGTGLMDVGVGGFMVASGLVSPETKKMERHQNLLSTIKSTFPLWFLGIGRVIIVYLTKYHLNKVEYGIYWNFFLTLATVKTVSTMILFIVPPQYSVIAGIVVAVTYEFCLEVLGLKTIILKSTSGDFNREGFFNANREGICACVGYLSIYLISVSFGRHLANNKCRFREWLQTLIMFVLMTGLFWLSLVYSRKVFDEISRRMANMTFIIWMMAHQMFILSTLLAVDLIEILMQYGCLTYRTRLSQPEFCLMEAINRNGLFFFLLANILTGAFNCIMNTKDAGPMLSFCTLVVYMLILSISVTELYLRNITFTFWK